MKNIFICVGAVGFAITAIAVSSPSPADIISSEVPVADGGLFLAQAAPTCSPTPDDQD